MDDELTRLLRRLGLTRGVRDIRPPNLFHSKPQPADITSMPLRASLEQLFPSGRLVAESDGACFVVDHLYPIAYRHGNDILADLLEIRPMVAKPYGLDDRLSDIDFRDFLFLDTETTGLAGASTFAFMVGVAFFESHTVINDGVEEERDVLVVRQYFLRDQEDESEMLHQLDERLSSRAGLITFNGKAFDVPLLDQRYLMNRRRSRLMELPHLDLLQPARRLFRARLGSCALGALEHNLLGLRRTQADVPGWQIPSIYFDYLRSGDAQQLSGVFYHNEMDMLSMVTLASRIFRQLGDSRCDDPTDQLSLGRWQADLGMTDLAEDTLRSALDGDLPMDTYHQTLLRLGMIYKQSDRRSEAVTAWQQIASTSFDDITAHVELAKHYEWHEKDLAAAILWVRRAIALLEKRTMTAQSRLVYADLRHRLERLERKRSGDA